MSIFSADRGCGQVEGWSNGARTRGWQETRWTLQSANQGRCESTRVALSNERRGEYKGRCRNGMSAEW